MNTAMRVTTRTRGLAVKSPRLASATAGMSLRNLVEVDGFLVLLVLAIRLFGTVDFVAGSLETLFYRRARVRHAADVRFLVSLAADSPVMPSLIWRAWCCACITLYRFYSSIV